jgi:mannosyltransferase OCH1-like enzyme
VIPRVLHHIWLGADDWPGEAEERRRTWLDHHPDWEHRLWSEDVVPAGLRVEVYERLRNPSERSDLLRLEILWRYGGVYVDADVECRRPLDPLLEGRDLLVATEKGEVAAAVLGATAGHPFIAQARAEIKPRKSYGWTVEEKTGAGFLAQVLAGFPDVSPVPEVLAHADEGRDAYAVHHSDTAWKQANMLRTAVRDAQRRLQLATEDLRVWRTQAEAAEARLADARAARV